MSDQLFDPRASSPGSPADRKISALAAGTATAGYSFGVALLVATFNWIEQCHTGVGWFWIPPEGSLVDMWALAVLPVVHTLGRIGMNRLQKWEKASES